MTINEGDREWLAQNYPNLRCILDGEHATIEGQFDFIAAYDDRQKRYVINPKGQHEALHVIQDSYQIRIIFSAGKSEYPKVWEIGGRLQDVAAKLGKNLADLHIIPADGSLCLVGPFDIQLDITFHEYFDGPLLQFFYDQSFYERYGRWARGEYSHGVLGILENYYDKVREGHEFAESCLSWLVRHKSVELLKLIFKNSSIAGHFLCACGSGLKFRSCHAGALEALRHLQKYVRMDSTISRKEILKSLLQHNR